jgi:hypothetical protein
MYISLFTATIFGSYTSDFLDLCEATTYVIFKDNSSYLAESTLLPYKDQPFRQILGLYYDGHTKVNAICSQNADFLVLSRVLKS